MKSPDLYTEWETNVKDLYVGFNGFQCSDELYTIHEQN